jgi:hypothetical protein
MSYPKFHDPSVFKDNRVQPHPFENGMPEYVVCLRCGTSPHSRYGLRGPKIHNVVSSGHLKERETADPTE